MKRGLPAAILILPLAAETADLPPTLVLADRRDVSPAAEWSAETIAEFAPRTLDELLATDPSFSTYRGQSGLLSHPTSAGVSLRNTGATAASRTLVLRDGIPQNDPFGGWVEWARFDPWSLESAALVPAARSAAWGNLSPAGSIQLTRRDLDANRALLRLTAGSHGTYGGSLSADLVNDDATLGIGFHAFGLHSDGFQVLPEWQRGPIDQRLALDLSGADLRAVWRPDGWLTVEPAFSYYEERRNNGTPLAFNRTEAVDASLRITSDDAGLSWQLLGYYQRRRFGSTFTSVDATRSAETIALNQFDVPGEGVGGAFTIRKEVGDTFDFTLGTDLRLLRGETNEDVGTFRRRLAGGSQSLAGLFGTASWEPAPTTRLDGSLRLDHWSLGDAKRIERSLSSGALLLSDYPTNRDAWEPSAALSIAHDLTDSLRADLSLSTSFRLPTLNELHRPYRVRNDLTEANPALDPERFYSIEGGIEWTPVSCLTLGATAFHHWIHDAIANVPVTDPAAIAAIFGTLPPGGTGAQRQNVDEARVYGLQTSAAWSPDDCWTLRLDALWSETEFSSSKRQPLLEGRPFPLAPELRAIGQLEFRPSERWSFFTGLEYGASRFDDELGQRELPSYTTVRLGASWRASDRLTLHGRIENLFDEDIPTALAGNGLRSYGQPRAFWLTAEWAF
ncbi:TonB-dependent receptor [Haloferula sargassicola]|uniref:Vitamin B12 transporter BtuB n=1 Tax=Haloferula sargassicola TaxID=490096 RepID=A0ABP9UIJ2_9BACT